MDGVELLGPLSRLRRAQVGAVRVPHKPLLVLGLRPRRPSARLAPGQPPVDTDHLTWHDRQVFRGTAAA